MCQGPVETIHHRESQACRVQIKIGANVGDAILLSWRRNKLFANWSSKEPSWRLHIVPAETIIIIVRVVSAQQQILYLAITIMQCTIAVYPRACSALSTSTQLHCGTYSGPR